MGTNHIHIQILLLSKSFIILIFNIISYSYSTLFANERIISGFIIIKPFDIIDSTTDNLAIRPSANFNRQKNTLTVLSLKNSNFHICMLPFEYFVYFFFFH